MSSVQAHLKFVNTTAIVLRSNNFSDSDKIFSLLSCDVGKFSAIAKGVRKITSKKAGHLNLGFISKMFLVSGKNMHIITQAETMLTPPENNLAFSLEIFECLEVLNKLSREDLNSKILFPIYESFLIKSISLDDFYRKALRVSGFWQNRLETCLLSELRDYFENIVESKLSSRSLKI
jgi:DNA repair protein RecO (recombination protein O)